MEQKMEQMVRAQSDTLPCHCDHRVMLVNMDGHPIRVRNEKGYPLPLSSSRIKHYMQRTL